MGERNAMLENKKGVEQIAVTHYGEDYAVVQVNYYDGAEAEFEVSIPLAEALENYLEGIDD